MRELIRTNDIVVLSCAKAILSEAGIGYIVLDEHTGANLGLIACRLMVEGTSYLSAVGTLRNGGLGSFIYDPL